MSSIDLVIIGEDTSEVFFRIKNTTQFSQVFSSYKEKQGIAQIQCSFYYNNVCMNESDTAVSLDMKHDDKIYSKICDNDITILVKHNDDILQYNVPKSTFLVSFLMGYTNGSSDTLFFYRDKQLNISDTPKSIGMKNDDVIEIYTL